MRTGQILDNVLSALGEKVVVLDRKGIIIAVNSPWKQSYQTAGGSEATCSVGVNYLDVCHAVSGKDGLSAVLAANAIESVISGKEIERSIEYVCDRPSGPENFLMKVKRLDGPDGGALVIHRRITEESLDDLGVLRARVDQCKKMLDVVPALISYVDKDRRYRFANRQYSEWFGGDLGEITGRQIRDVIGETAYDAMQPDFERVFRGELVRFERLMKYKTGGDRFVRGSLIPDLDEDGSVQGYFALLLDDTEHHGIENELRLSEERFSKLFNFIPIALTISSLKDGKYIEVNEAYLKISGFEREKILARPTTESGIHMPEDRVKEFLEAMARDGSVSNFETDLEFDDGRHQTVLLNAVTLELDGEPFLAVAANEITARKQAERSLRDLTTRLLNSQDAERRRIARELHDTTAQKVSTLLIALSYLSKLIEKPKKEIAQTLTDSIKIAEEALAEIRTLSYVLHPPLLDQSGLRSAIRWFVHGFSRRSSIKVEVAFAGEEKRLPPDMESAIFRIVQETLTNIHRHSGSSNAFMLLDQRPDEVLLEVRDEGRAILRKTHEAEATAYTDVERLGIGITGMRERLRQFGGDLQIDIAENGTCVTARIPVNG